MEKDLNEEYQDLMTREQWAENVAKIISESGIHNGISHEIALNAARAAGIWIDAFREILDRGDCSAEVAIIASRKEAVEKSENLTRYPTTGELTIVSIIAMNEAFILAFAPAEQAKVRDLAYSS